MWPDAPGVFPQTRSASCWSPVRVFVPAGRVRAFTGHLRLNGGHRSGDWQRLFSLALFSPAFVIPSCPAIVRTEPSPEYRRLLRLAALLTHDCFHVLIIHDCVNRRNGPKDSITRLTKIVLDIVTRSC